MKKITFLCVIAAIVWLSPQVCRGAEKSVFAVVGFPEESREQLLEIVTNIFDNLSEKGKVHLGVETIEKVSQLEEAIENRTVSLFIHQDYGVIADYLRDDRVEPFISYSFYGVRDGKKCFFVRKEDEAGSIEELKGRRAGMFGSSLDYYNLTELLGENPDVYFSSITRNTSGPALLRALDKDEIDTAFVMSYSLVPLKMNTPQFVSEVRMLDCPLVYKMYPIFYVKDSADSGLKDTLVDIFTNYRDEAAFKTYLPLMKQFKVKFYPVGTESYSEMIGLYNKAEEKGWDKDFEAWLMKPAAE